LRRKARRYRFGAYLRESGSRLREKVSVVEIYWGCIVKSPVGPVVSPMVRSYDPSKELRGPSHVRARDGAEKSCRIRRRKRGLRRGKRRSRGRHPRRTAAPTANVSKPPSSRKINHIGRKFIWAVKASNQLRKDCEKYNKFPRGELDVNHPAYRARRNMKCYCLAKWTRLHKQAEVSGIPPVAAFHDSFWKYLLVETSRGGIGDWDMLLSGLPRKPTPEPVVETNPFAALFGSGLSVDPSGAITFRKRPERG